MTRSEALAEMLDYIDKLSWVHGQSKGKLRSLSRQLASAEPDPSPDTVATEQVAAESEVIAAIDVSLDAEILDRVKSIETLLRAMQPKVEESAVAAEAISEAVASGAS